MVRYCSTIGGDCARDIVANTYTMNTAKKVLDLIVATLTARPSSKTETEIECYPASGSPRFRSRSRSGVGLIGGTMRCPAGVCVARCCYINN